MKRLILFLFTIVLFMPSGLAFEDTFQYYPGGGTGETFLGTWERTHSGAGSSGIVTHDATYSRAYGMYCFQGGGGGFSGCAQSISNIVLSTSTYWSFTVRSAWQAGGNDNHPGHVYVAFFDSEGILIFEYEITNGNTGFYEFSQTGGGISLRRNGVNIGTVSGSTSSMSYIRFRLAQDGGNWYYAGSELIVDDISTDGNIIGIGTESTSHTLTESNLQPTNISWTAYSFPFADFTAARYNVSVQRYVNGVYTELTNDEVKPATATTPLQGIKSYLRGTNFTDSDTSYGLYWAFLQKDGSNIANDYFYLAPPGSASTISFTDSNIVIGQEEDISYSIASPDYSTYNYHVRVYSSSEQVFSEQVLSDSGTVSWDSTGSTAGIYFTVLSRTAKADGTNYDELTYDTATVSANILISGITYDLQNGTALGNVNVNISQGSTWYNTTSNATTGAYQLFGLEGSIPTVITTSKTNYLHEDFTFTPLVAQPYEIDLYLLSNSPSYSNTTILGQVYDYPYHQPVVGATVTASIGARTTTETQTCDGATNGSWCNFSVPINVSAITSLTIKDGSVSFATEATKRVDNPIPDGTRPYQLSLNLSNSSGTNNATHVFCNGNCNINFTDIRFTLDNTTELPYWIENVTTGKVWVNVTANGTVNMYYGNPNAVSASNGTNTFIQWHGAATANFIDPLIVPYVDVIFQSKFKPLTNSRLYTGLAKQQTYSGTTDSVLLNFYGGNLIYFSTADTTYTQVGASGWSLNTWYDIKLVLSSPTYKAYLNGADLWSGISTNLPNENLGLMMWFDPSGSGTAIQEYSFVRKYASPEPTWATWGAEETPETFESWALPEGGVESVHYLNGVSYSPNLTGLSTVQNIQIFRNISNATNVVLNVLYTATEYTTNTTTSETGFYKLENIPNGTYSIKSTKPGYLNSSTYITSTTNSFWKIQNIIMSELYTLIVTAQDATTSANIQEFQVTFNSITYTTTNGSLTISSIPYGSYTLQVASTGYYASSRTLLMDKDKNEVVTLTQYVSNDYYPNYVYTKFIVKGLFDNPYAGLTITVHEGTDLTETLYTGLTDSMGQAVFKLTKDQYYTIVLTGGGLSEPLTYYVYGKDEEYLIRIIGGFPSGGNRGGDINATLTWSVFNATYNNLSVIYNDTTASTTALNFYATNISTGATCYQSSALNVVTLNCTVLASGVYQFGFNATSTTYGYFKQDKIIDFDSGDSSNPLVPHRTDATTIHWASIILIVLVASMFSIRNVKHGVVVVPLLALILWTFGWFQAPILLISIAIVIGIMIYMRMSEIKTEV